MVLYYMFLLLSPFQDNPKVGTEVFRLGFIAMTPIKLIGMGAIGVALLSPRPALRPTIVSKLYAGFALLPLSETIVFGWPMPVVSLSALISYVLLLIATRLLVWTPLRIIAATRSIVIGNTIGALYLYEQYYVRHWPRPIGPSSDPNYEALNIVMVIPLAICLFQSETSRFWRRIALGCTLVLVFGMFLSQSRGGLLALSVLALAGWLRIRRKLLVLVAMVAVIGIAAALAPAATWQRLREIQISGRADTGAEVSTRTRVELVKGGLKMIKTHPIFGVGLDQFKPLVGHYNPNLYSVIREDYIAHNTYVQVAAEGGVPTLLLFLALIRTAFVNCRRAARYSSTSSPRIAHLALAMRLGLLAYMVAACFLTAEFEKPFWFMIFLSPNLCDAAAPAVEAVGSHTQAREPAVGMHGFSRSIRNVASQAPTKPTVATEHRL